MFSFLGISITCSGKLMMSTIYRDLGLFYSFSNRTANIFFFWSTSMCCRPHDKVVLTLQKFYLLVSLLQQQICICVGFGVIPMRFVLFEFFLFFRKVGKTSLPAKDVFLSLFIEMDVIIEDAEKFPICLLMYSIL